MQTSPRTGRPWRLAIGAAVAKLGVVARGRKRAISAATDGALAFAALWFGWTLRQGQAFTDFRTTWYLFVLVPAVTVGVFGAFGIYRWVVRSSNGRMFREVAKACAVSALCLVSLLFLIPPDRTSPRSLFVLYGLLLLVGTIAVRLAWQSLFDSAGRGMPVALYGAGATGRRLTKLLASDSAYRPVLFLDDDRALLHSTVAGLRVLDGNDPELHRTLVAHDVQQVVIAMPSLSRELLEDKLRAFAGMGLPVKTVPSVNELVAGIAVPGEIRDISIADILGRAEVVPDVDLMGRRVSGKRVLVTGGAGSIGAELSRQILALGPARLVVLDCCEAALYAVTEELGSTAPGEGGSPDADPFHPVLGSINDRRGLDRLLCDHRIETVFHAAAYKHVPIVERQPERGVETNVFGTLGLVEASISAGVADFVLVSTDKAVRPANAMGASKRVAELVLQAMSKEQGTTRLSMVRFGNVLGSSGSVVPKFRRQILSGGPVTVTDPGMERYFMTIPEAAQLVLQAGALARGGEVFVLDMGVPVRIVDLAKSMIRLYGRRPRSETHAEGDIEIRFDGVRPGEKLTEELFITGDHRATAVSRIFCADEASLPLIELLQRLDALRGALDAHDVERLRQLLFEIARIDGQANGKAVVPVSGQPPPCPEVSAGTRHLVPA